MTHLGARIFHEGPAHLPTVVFLHAFPYHSAMWAGQCAALRHKARVVTLDARGLGPHRSPLSPYMLEHEVDDLLSVFDKLSIERAMLCGLSMGGYVALRAIERAPARICGLLLADTQAAADSDAAKLARAEGVRALMRDGVQTFAESQLKRQLSPHTLEHSAALVTELRAMIAESSVEGIAAALVAISTRTDLTPSLGKIRVPTRVIVGADDTITPPAVARAMAEQIPGADLHILENAGHLSNLEAKAAFDRLLVEHVARCA